LRAKGLGEEKPVPPYSAIVYKEGGEVRAEDWKGRKIASGEDGVDDGSVIQSAIDNLPPSGGLVQLREGTFTISNTISLRSFTTLKGLGRRATILELSPNSNCDMIRLASVEKVVLAQLSLHGNKNYQSSGNGIVLDEVGGFEITNVEIKYIYNTGITTSDTQGAWVGAIRNVGVEYCGGVGIHLHPSGWCNAILFDTVASAMNAGNGFVIQGNIENVVFINCIAEGNASGKGDNARQWLIRGVSLPDKSVTLYSCWAESSEEYSRIVYTLDDCSGVVIERMRAHGNNATGIKGFFIEGDGTIIRDCKAMYCSYGLVVGGTENIIESGQFGTYSIASGNIVRKLKDYFTDAFKATSKSVSVGTNDAYGDATIVRSPSGIISALRVCKIVIGGTFATGENVTVKVETNWKSGNTAYVEKTYTATGTYYLDLDGQDGLDLWRDSDMCTSIKIYAKSDQASTSVTVACDLAGAG